MPNELFQVDEYCNDEVLRRTWVHDVIEEQEFSFAEAFAVMSMKKGERLKHELWAQSDYSLVRI